MLEVEFMKHHGVMEYISIDVYVLLKILVFIEYIRGTITDIT